MNPDTNALYSESQPFRQVVAWILLLAFVAFLWYAIYHQIIQGEPFGTSLPPDVLLIFIWLIFGILLPIAFLKSRLSISIDRHNLSYRFFPLHLNVHNIPVRQIQNIESVRIRPILEFGGWGIRYGLKGKGYIMGGKKGIKVSFYSGRPVYFTAEKPEGFIEAFQRVKQSNR